MYDSAFSTLPVKCTPLRLHIYILLFFTISGGKTCTTAKRAAMSYFWSETPNVGGFPRTLMCYVNTRSLTPCSANLGRKKVPRSTYRMTTLEPSTTYSSESWFLYRYLCTTINCYTFKL